MWMTGQWLWDRKDKKPVQFVDIFVFADRRKSAQFVIYGNVPGTVKKFPFKDSSFWSERFTELYDKQGNIL